MWVPSEVSLFFDSLCQYCYHKSVPLSSDSLPYKSVYLLKLVVQNLLIGQKLTWTIFTQQMVANLDGAMWTQSKLMLPRRNLRRTVIANMMAFGAGSVKCLYYLFALTSVLVVGIAAGDFVRLNENSHLPIIVFSSKVVILFCGRHIYQLDMI